MQSRLEKTAQEGQIQETDVWWGSYDIRSMLPLWLLLAIASGALMAIARFLKEPHAPQLVLVTECLLLAFWVFQIWLWFYRVFCISYRLTNRRLFIRRGFGHPGAPGLALDAIDQIEVSFQPLERLAGVGRIHLRMSDPEKRTVTLTGIYQPREIASLLKKSSAQVP